MPLVLVTRPAPMAAATAEKLREMGCEPLVAPLFDIRPRPDAALDLAGVQALVFTSRNGVRAFAEKSDRRDLPAWCVGAATAALAREEGFEQVVEGPGDATRLAELLVGKLDVGAGALLHPSGAEIAIDLAEELRPYDIELRRAVIYDAVPRAALPDDAAAALAAGEVAAVLFYSPRAAARFAKLAAPALAPDRTHALCLSDAVARPVAALPWRCIETAAEPNEAALLAGLKPVLAALTSAATEPEMSETAEDTSRPAPAPVPPARAGGAGRVFGWLVAVLVMVVIAMAAVLAAPQWRPVAARFLPPELIVEPGVQERQRVDALEGAVTALRDQLAASEQALADAELKLDAVAERTAGDDGVIEDFAAMSTRLDGLERTLGDLFALVEDLPAGGEGGASVGAMVELRERLGALETDLAGLREAQRQAAGDLERLAGAPQVAPEDIQGLRGEVAALREQQTKAGEDAAVARAEAGAQRDELAARLDGFAALATRLEETGGQIAALERQLATLSEERGATGARLDELAGEVTALREDLAATRAAAGGLADLDERLAQMQGAIGGNDERNAEVAARLDELDTRTAGIARAGQQAALALQLGQLQAAVERGAPFARELNTVKRLAGEDQSAIAAALAPLAGHAETGVASRRRLTQRFAVLVPEILNAPQRETDAGWLGAVSRTLGGLVTVRRVETDPAAGGVDAILARAEAALARDDLAAALAALDDLPPAEAAIAAPWIETARARLAAETALDDAAAALVATLAGER